METNRNEKSFLIIIFFIIQIFIIVIVITLINTLSNENKIKDIEHDRLPSVDINNIVDSTPETTEKYIEAIERELVKIIELNNYDINTSEIQAIIRENTISVKQFDEIDGHYVSAIIDIPRLSQSYKFFSHYPSKESTQNETPSNLLYFTCLDDEDEKIYEVFDCRDSYSLDIYNSILAYYLKNNNFDNYMAFVDYDKPFIVYIALNDLNANDDTKQSYINQVKETIESFNIPSKIFKYKTITQSDFSNLPD